MDALGENIGAIQSRLHRDMIFVAKVVQGDRSAVAEDVGAWIEKNLHRLLAAEDAYGELIAYQIQLRDSPADNRGLTLQRRGALVRERDRGRRRICGLSGWNRCGLCAHQCWQESKHQQALHGCSIR